MRTLCTCAVESEVMLSATSQHPRYVLTSWTEAAAAPYPGTQCALGTVDTITFPGAGSCVGNSLPDAARAVVPGPQGVRLSEIPHERKHVHRFSERWARSGNTQALR